MGKIPPDVKVGAIAAVAADSRGYVYVYHRFDPLIESIAPPPCWCSTRAENSSPDGAAA